MLLNRPWTAWTVNEALAGAVGAALRRRGDGGGADAGAEVRVGVVDVADLRSKHVNLARSRNAVILIQHVSHGRVDCYFVQRASHGNGRLRLVAYRAVGGALRDQLELHRRAERHRRDLRAPGTSERSSRAAGGYELV